MIYCLVLLLLANLSVADAASIRALPLPDGFTISPETEYRGMVVSSNGTVLAIAISTEKMPHRLVLRWTSAGDVQRFMPLSLVPDKPLRGEEPFPAAIAAVNGNQAYVTVGQTFDGAHIHSLYDIERWSGDDAVRWKMPNCAEYYYHGAHLLAIDRDGDMALTLDPSASSAGIDLGNQRSVDGNLPMAVVLAHGKCVDFGHAILTAIDGLNVAGYRGYLDGRLAPWFINEMVQQRVAHTGLTVGATALPGHAHEYVYGNFFGPPGKYEYAIPHAVAWLPNGKELFLTHGDARSVAYDVNENGTIVGMEQMPDGRHYAFRFLRGKRERMDDLPHPHGWRFESAYAIASDGSIVGIGTFNDTPTAFVWRDATR